jgi:hypothetical protein
MQQMLRLVIVLFVAVSSLESSGQSGPTTPSYPTRETSNQQSLDPPAVQGRFRPKLSLQDALKIAESYVEKEGIDVSSYWLYQVHFILVGDANTPDNDKLPCWHFWWVSDDGALGDYVEIMVTMDGRTSRAPSM